MKKLYAYVLVHRRTNTIIKEGGISFKKEETEPNKIYNKEFKAKRIEIK